MITSDRLRATRVEDCDVAFQSATAGRVNDTLVTSLQVKS